MSIYTAKSMDRTYHTGVLVFDFVINTLLTVVEYAAGIASGSAAILADASQNLTDSLVLSIAFVCERLIDRPRLSKREVATIYVMAGSLNALILICLSLYVGVLAIHRTLHPQPVNTTLVVAIGLLSIGINWLAAGLLFTAHRDSTIRAPYTGLIFSGVSGVGVLLSGVTPHFWHFRQVDGVAGLLIAALLFIRSTRLLAASLRADRSGKR